MRASACPAAHVPGAARALPEKSGSLAPSGRSCAPAHPRMDSGRKRAPPRRAPGRTRPVRPSTPCCSAETRRVGAAGPPAAGGPSAHISGALCSASHRSWAARTTAPGSRAARPRPPRASPGRDGGSPRRAAGGARWREGRTRGGPRSTHRPRVPSGAPRPVPPSGPGPRTGCGRGQAWQPARRRRPARRFAAGTWAAGRSGCGEAAPRLAGRPPRPRAPDGRWRRGRRGSAKADRRLAPAPR